MKTYIHCREVKAFRIKKIIEARSYDDYGQLIVHHLLVPYDQCELTVIAPAKYMENHHPEKGGWFLRHPDGLYSFYTDDQFNGCYKLCNAENHDENL